jgi:mannose-6-phosphate isomerase-like protein (cupin superfamily)
MEAHEMSTQSLVTRLDEVVPFELHEARFFPLSSPSRGGTELAVWQLRLAPDTVGVPHLIDREEVFILAAGELLIQVDDAEPVRLLPGDAVAVAGGCRLSANSGPEGAVATVCTRAGLQATMADGSVISPPWAS